MSYGNRLQREEELRQREALIREVRALQQVRAACARAEAEERRRDDATTAGLGLLCEMSIAELRERLQLLREELEEELQLRQRRAREQRHDHDALLQHTQRFVQQRRSELRSAPKPQKQELKVPDTEELEALRKKLAEKRELRKKMEAAEKLSSTTSSSAHSAEEQSCSQIEEQSYSQIQLEVNSTHA
ncbi:trichohyalin-like [Schistocerca serialis cubense]|uniref:trichohyalin-like n=1 Tax=Schistocerca serialis cubense TaxID=2023355 RepID=UPI00214F2AA3|nr:trichohyalin-like [Schistocerca serialis cubense]